MQQKHQDNGPEVQKQCGKLEEKPSTSSTLTPLCPPVFVDDCLFDLEMERKQTRAIALLHQLKLASIHIDYLGFSA